MKKTSLDWREKVLDRIRTLIHQADPGVIEEVKYRMPSRPGGIPVWYHDGMICTGETYKAHVRLTFAKGALLKETSPLFNRHSAIILSEGDKINDPAFKTLIRAAVALNRKTKGAKGKTSART